MASRLKEVRNADWVISAEFCWLACCVLARQQAAVSAKGRVSLRNPVSSAANMAPMAGLRTSSFAPTSFHVKSETELRAAVNTISMALKEGQTPVVIGDGSPHPTPHTCPCCVCRVSLHMNGM